MTSYVNNKEVNVRQNTWNKRQTEHSRLKSAITMSGEVSWSRKKRLER